MMAETASVPAPAKVNLFLRVTGQRNDGYHNIQTWFQLLDYGDELTFSPRDDGEITVRIGTRIERAQSDFASVIDEKDNSVIRAAAAMRRCCPDKASGADIALHKKIPVGAGLGGGSSDAATVLSVLNKLWKCGLSAAELLGLAKGLGADVPVFVSGKTAWAEGIGERLMPMSLPEAWYAVLVPPLEISTAQMFQAPELDRNCRSITVQDYRAGQDNNVFEPLVRARYPEVAEAFDWLAQYGRARLSGSGGGVFAAFPDFAQATAVVERKPAHLFGFVARGLNQSPLVDALSSAF